MTDPNSAPPGPVAAAMSAVTSLNKSAAALDQLREDVRSGRVKLEEWAGKKLKEALAAQQILAEEWRREATALEQALPLGEHWVGKQMADKMSRRASGTDFSFAAQIHQYINQLERAQIVLDEAIKATTGADSDGKSDFEKRKRH